MTGKVDAGPNAVLALAREGYRHSDINLRDLASSFSLADSGVWRGGTGAVAWVSGTARSRKRHLLSLAAAFARGEGRSGARGIRRPGSGPHAGRRLGGRLPVCAFGKSAARVECSFSRRDRFIDDRQIDC